MSLTGNLTESIPNDCGMVLDLLGEGVVITLDRGKTWPVGLNWPN